MYPIIRTLKELIKYRSAPPLGPSDIHVSHHRCWPQDIDMFLELNNTRVLSIMELSRNGLALRTGLISLLRKKRWGLTIAGTSVRYRKRIRPFQRFEIRSHAACWDDKFIYIVQSIWLGDDCAAQALFRTGVVSNHRLVPIETVFEAAGFDQASPPIPTWIANWIDAEKTRPWPPNVA